MRRLLVPIALAALVLTACGDRNDDSSASADSSASPSSSSAPTSSTPSETAPAGSTAANSGSCEVAVSSDTTTQPTVTVPKDCDPPPALQSKDVVAGTGAALKPGQTAVVQYDLYTWSNGKEADSSWSGGQPFPVQNVGQAQVIDGWNTGLPGMKQGGRRLLVIPPDQGYGPGGAPPAIGPNETLVFVVDLLQITG